MLAFLGCSACAVYVTFFFAYRSLQDGFVTKQTALRGLQVLGYLYLALTLLLNLGVLSILSLYLFYQNDRTQRIAPLQTKRPPKEESNISEDYDSARKELKNVDSPCEEDV